MTFEAWWKLRRETPFALVQLPAAKEAWNAARPQPLTDDEIRKCWRACEGLAPMAFAREIQKKLGVIDDN